MNDKFVLGYWMKTKTRCDYCHKAREMVYVVPEGPTTGKFCSKFCYQSARERMEHAKQETPQE